MLSRTYSSFKAPTRSISNKRSLTCAKATQETKQASFLQFAETVNGRAAMQGFIWGSLTEAMTGNTIKEQLVSANPAGGLDIIPGDVLAATTVIGLVALGTAITAILPNEELQDSSMQLAGPFTSDAEVLNGRAAMIGFVILSLMQ